MSDGRKLPVARDVRIARHGGDAGGDGDEVVSAASSKSKPNLVTVMGFDKKDVLFRSDSVGTVQWRDQDGEIAALLVRLKPGVWGFSKSGDDDWNEVVGLYGNPDY